MKGSPGPLRSSPTLHRTVRPSGRTAEHCPPNAYSHRALLTQSLTRGFESAQGALFAQQASFPHYFHVGLAYLIIIQVHAGDSFPALVLAVEVGRRCKEGGGPKNGVYFTGDREEPARRALDGCQGPGKRLARGSAERLALLFALAWQDAASSAPA
jgi:hypothetical protein